MLGEMRHFEDHRASHADVVKNNYSACDLAVAIVDWRGRIFDGGFIPVPSNQNAVRGKPHGSILLNCKFGCIWRGQPRSSVDDVKDFCDWMADCFLAGPSRHSFGNNVQVGDVA